MLSTPLQVTGRVIGVLNVVDPARDHFQDSDLRFVEPMAAAAATAIENARLYTGLQQSHRLIRQTFGRYLSEEIVRTILETPDGLKLGGQESTVTIMMTDIRGFTSLCERLSAEQVVAMLPAMKSPTVQPLSGDSAVSVKVAVLKEAVPALITQLKRAGATDMLETRIRRGTP